ncbi:bifunctional 4-hydroxy-2-oxoglutarate aldolase/2-dehydro-3-deoxy-phosphogluconate aldolase [Frigoribacterium sp. ACAM 257]|uniref:bifunctional 4-hydroxy-2-oxoglutarate aldolase/2-dehydro-3-deoxy-phosphogluconate aldolase n=1 Tax=Frigoribacterium sp. ACAM 257 TaxID=2508998 RepID=UPI0011B9C46E|nr:bifunctional 4-hydroxy-2-oxoglutarate aldolase/2-dehydro-3-deoxy-phosphogluconate aldolase [Frigoribacterium sp. ACAM 257]TWX40019.1 bifunctional 4-hydroxy-2-oxoglutarate aldolase/2-dehydro-3-deoxy-phosphogluconate aldolase [Frigoribacterium sp. ACAM 257]
MTVSSLPASPPALAGADARTPPSAAVRESHVIAVLRASRADELEPVVEALVSGGIRSIELTLTTPGALDVLPELVARFAGVAEIGLGTVTTVEQAVAAVDHGAAYVVTPITSTEIAAAVTSRHVPFYPGGLTPSELWSSWTSGATAVKLFPASTVGPGYLGQLRGPFPDLRVVPSGGIELDEVPAWIRAGSLAVSLGGPLLRDAFEGGARSALEERARRVVGLALEAEEAR